MKKTLYSLSIIICLLFASRVAFAETKIDYNGQPVLDSDLDGLTDEGEKQIYRTDSNNPDTDGDGILDGAEAIGGGDPMDASSPRAKEVVTNNTYKIEKDPSWPWYIIRSFGMVSFLLLYVSIFLGIAIRFPGLRRLINPAYSLDIHRLISVQALFFALFHGLAGMWDKYINLTLKDVFIPFASSYEPGMMALGTIAMYLMVALIVSSYLKSRIPYGAWRAIHSLNFFLYAFSFVHAIHLGTDLQSGVLRTVFIYANALLMALLIMSISLRAFNSYKSRRAENYEDIRQD
ncbi:MAG: hypothetical protein HGB08_01185 [Candidatus Moranbacteria bacterium]|nr:hypothetical protein [Candidatus Moranbacteria bacterium]